MGLSAQRRSPNRGMWIFLQSQCRDHSRQFTSAERRVCDEIRICEGDAIRDQLGVRHWHGATDTTHMTHLAITGRTGGSNVEWGEAVSDGQYLAGLDEQ